MYNFDQQNRNNFSKTFKNYLTGKLWLLLNDYFSFLSVSIKFFLSYIAEM